MRLSRILLLPLISCPPLVLAYDADTCCQLAKDEGMFVGHVPELADQICGQRYGNYNAAQPLYVSYHFCRDSCPGVGLSRSYEPRQWAAPIVQFILPSVIFSMNIPRRKKIKFDYVFDWKVDSSWPWMNNVLRLGRSIILFSVILIPVIIDTLAWIFVIVTGAGNMIVGGLFEAHIDWRIVRYAENKEFNDLNDVDLEVVRQLLVTVVSGNLDLQNEKSDPFKTITESLTLTTNPESAFEVNETSRRRLLDLLGAQSSFGSAVGSPVLFYLGAFVYTVLDLLNDESDEDSAISLGFGIEWMIIVHVAIISGCLLAANNPATSSSIVGKREKELAKFQRASTIKPDDTYRSWNGERFMEKILGWGDAYETTFQPVNLSRRGMNKMQWVERTHAWQDDRDGFRQTMRLTRLGFFWKIFIPAVMLIILPPAAGGIVAYYTPPKGIGCRSLSMVLYACAQLVVTTFAVIRNAVDDQPCESESEPSWKWTFSKSTWSQDLQDNLRWLFTGLSFSVISSPWWCFAFVASIVGITFQITGVYRNCICYAGADSWWNIDHLNPAIQLATDTQDKRDASGFWIPAGICATAFMAFNCYLGWWYQKLVRHRFTEIVENMKIPSRSQGVSHSNTMGAQQALTATTQQTDSSGANVSVPPKEDSDGHIASQGSGRIPQAADVGYTRVPEFSVTTGVESDGSRSPSRDTLLDYGLPPDDNSRDRSPASQTPLLDHDSQAGASSSAYRPLPRVVLRDGFQDIELTEPTQPALRTPRPRSNT